MKCPICGQELTQSKKDPNYMLCYNCRKKFRVSQQGAGAGQTQSGQSSAQARTIEARQTARSSRQEYNDSYDDPYYDEGDDYEEEHLSMTPVVVLGVAIVIVLGLIIYMLVL